MATAHAQPESFGCGYSDALDRAITDIHNMYGSGELAPPVYDEQITRPASVATVMMSDPNGSKAFRAFCGLTEEQVAVVLPSLPRADGRPLTTVRICRPETPQGTRDVYATVKMRTARTAGGFACFLARARRREPSTVLQIVAWQGTGQAPEDPLAA